MTTATKTQGTKINKGDIFLGFYMGYEFNGTVSAIEGNQSGYRGDENHVRVYIKLDKDMGKDGRVRSKTGDLLVMDCRAVGNGLLKREDSRYTKLTLRQKKQTALRGALKPLHYLISQEKS